MALQSGRCNKISRYITLSISTSTLLNGLTIIKKIFHHKVQDEQSQWKKRKCTNFTERKQKTESDEMIVLNNPGAKESVQFSRSVMSDSLWPHGLQHARIPCPSPTPRVCSNSCPLSLWYHPTISSSVIPFSSCPQSFPGSGSFPRREFFMSGVRNVGVSASASALPNNT